MRTVALYAGAIIIAALLGWGGGMIVTNLRADAERLRTDASKLEFLKRNISGIVVGRPFPNVELIDLQTQQVRMVLDMVPDGGVVVFTAGDCGACLSTVAALDSAIHNPGHSGRPAIVINGGDFAGFKHTLSEGGINFPIYGDLKDELKANHGVVAFPAFFQIDAEGIVTAFDVSPRSSAELAELVE